MTEKITTSFLENAETAGSVVLAKEVFGKLMGSMTKFYEDCASPQMIKSQLLQLLTRLVLKLRYIIRQNTTKYDSFSRE
jgi:hypothetical protein